MTTITITGTHTNADGSFPDGEAIKARLTTNNMFSGGAYINKFEVSAAIDDADGTFSLTLHVPDDSEQAGRYYIVVPDNGYVTIPHYTNAEKPMFAVGGLAIGGSNIVYIGGGSSSFSCASQISIFVAANSTTSPGTERVRVTSAGNANFSEKLGVGTTLYGAPSEKLTVKSGAILLSGDSSTQERPMVKWSAAWNVSTDATRSADAILHARDYGGEREIMRGRGTGTAAAIGFLGATPAARQSHITDVSSGTDTAYETAINNILSVLETFGLVATS